MNVWTLWRTKSQTEQQQAIFLSALADCQFIDSVCYNCCKRGHLDRNIKEVQNTGWKKKQKEEEYAHMMYKLNDEESGAI